MTLHANLDGAPPASMAASPRSLVDDLGAIPGTTPTAASGICNEEGDADGDDGWLEVAVDAGITLSIGIVDYCQLSLDPAGSAQDAYAAAIAANCQTLGPVGCHDPAPSTEPDSFRLFPWPTTKTGEWLTSTGGAMLIVPTFAAVPADGASEGGPSGCVYATALDAQPDVNAIVSSIQSAAALVPPGQTGVYHFTWSTNRIATTEYIEEWFAEVGAAQASSLASLAEWRSLVDAATRF